jgi:hypothetical protein
MLAVSLAVMSFAAGMTWPSSGSELATGGERIARSPPGGMVWQDGFRCPKGRGPLLKY